MKKSILLLLLPLFCLSASGCTPTAQYIKESFDYSIHESYNQTQIDVHFRIKINSNVERVDYDILCYNKSNVLIAQIQKRDEYFSGSGEVQISLSKNFPTSYEITRVKMGVVNFIYRPSLPFMYILFAIFSGLIALGALLLLILFYLRSKNRKKVVKPTGI